MSCMILMMYLLGFAAVWGAVALVGLGVAWFRRFDNDWDRAFKRELLSSAGRSPVDIDLRGT
ncbi:MAG: hypothetical protein ACRDKF_06320 [Actinomycetota bacterium]